MKWIFIFLLTLITRPIFSQMDELVGNYYFKLGGKNHWEEYTLTLNKDKTFAFHFHREFQRGIPPITDKYGKGTWDFEVKKKFSTDYVLIHFATDKEEHLDDIHTLNFNESGARLVVKSPRDKSAEESEVKLQFYESGISWVEGKGLLKK